MSGFPSNRYELHSSLLLYWKLRDHLYTDGELALYGQKIVVSAAFCRRTLARLHDIHRGVEATRRRAKQTVFWPRIDSDIASTVSACEPCQVLLPSQRQEPMMNDYNPSRPFESISADFLTATGKSFLVIANRLSGWPVVVPCGMDTTPAHHQDVLPLLPWIGCSPASTHWWRTPVHQRRLLELHGALRRPPSSDITARPLVEWPTFLPAFLPGHVKGVVCSTVPEVEC